jgi:membrane protease YdiL (CAAX protease family)
VRTAVRTHPLAAYLVLAVVLSWSWWVPMALRGQVARPGDGWPTHLPGLLGPALSAVVMVALVDGRPGLRSLGRRLVQWRVGAGWWLLVAGTGSLAALGLVVPLLTGDPLPSLDDFGRYTGVSPIGLLGVVAVTFVVNGIGEETGWRGFAADRLLRTRSLRGTALAVAAAWAFWHLPLFWVVESFRSFGLVGTIGWLVGLTAGSVVLTWIYRGTGNSILLAAAWHTAFNLTAATEATGAVVGAVTSTAVIIGAVVLLRRDEPRPARVPQQ